MQQPDLTRRGFLLGAGAAVVAAAVPAIAAMPMPVETYNHIWLGNDGLYAVVSPTHMKLFSGEIGSWEGVRFIEAAPIPPMQFSYPQDPNSFDASDTFNRLLDHMAGQIKYIESHEVMWESPVSPGALECPSRPSNLRTFLTSTTHLTPAS